MRRRESDLPRSRLRTQDRWNKKLVWGFPVTSYGKLKQTFLTKPIHILRDETKSEKKKEQPRKFSSQAGARCQLTSTALTGKGFGNLTTKIPSGQMGKGNNDMEHTHMKTY